MKKIKIGQIGIGHNHGAAKAADCKRLPELFEFVGVEKNSTNQIQRRVSNRSEIGNATKLEEILKNITTDISQKGARNFTLLADRYLINIDNMQQLHFKSNLIGLHLVEAEFQDGQIVELYKGRDEDYAISLIRKYEKGEEKYLQQGLVKK